MCGGGRTLFSFSRQRKIQYTTEKKKNPNKEKSADVSLLWLHHGGPAPGSSLFKEPDIVTWCSSSLWELWDITWKYSSNYDRTIHKAMQMFSSASAGGQQSNTSRGLTARVSSEAHQRKISGYSSSCICSECSPHLSGWRSYSRHRDDAITLIFWILLM